MSDADLRHHGDAELAEGLVDLAVNVRRPAPPDWLRKALVSALDDIARYPDAAAATVAVAARHGVGEERVLVTSGGADAFTLLARALRPQIAYPVVIHPQFTEPELALRLAGHQVRQLILRPDEGFALDPAVVPAEADLVMMGNPTNPTSVLHRADTLRALARPGRVLCVDEAFLDAVPGQPEALVDATDVPGLVVVRSLTKTWGIAGVRAGYAVGDPSLIARLRDVQPPWSVNSLALAATIACSSPHAAAEADRQARSWADQARELAAALAGIDGVQMPVIPDADFVLARVREGERYRTALRERGWAVRGCASFPGLGPDWWRISVRDRATMHAFLDDLRVLLKDGTT